MPWGYNYSEKDIQRLKKGESLSGPDPTSSATQFGLLRVWFQRNYGWPNWPPYPKPWGYPILTEFDVELIAWARKCQERWYRQAQTEDTTNFTDWAHFFRNTALRNMNWPKKPETTMEVVSRISSPIIPWQKTAVSLSICSLGFLPPWSSLRLACLDNSILGKLWRPAYNISSSKNLFAWHQFSDARTTFFPLSNTGATSGTNLFPSIFKSLKVSPSSRLDSVAIPLTTATTGSKEALSLSIPKIINPGIHTQSFQLPANPAKSINPIFALIQVIENPTIFPRNFARVSSCTTGLIIYTMWSLLYI